jgi:hypothetical protein
MIKRLGLCLMAAAGFLGFAASVGNADGLVAFDRAKIREAKAACDIEVIAKLDNVAVGLLSGGHFYRLQEVDEKARQVESSADVDRLWVAFKSEDQPDMPGLLLATEHYGLLELSFSSATNLMASGIRLSKCVRIDLPADPPFIVPSGPGSASSLITDVDSLMALVSVDSVRSYIQRLQDFQTRYTCTDSFWAASQWISDRFESWGYDDVEFQVFDSPFGCDSRNVIATKTGEVHPDRYIILGGHCDAVVYDGGDPEVFAPGADDNGTGTAMAMEIARVLAETPFRQSVRFIAFGAEEQGLIGSWYYVADALQRGENITLMINADMIGNVSDSYLNFNVNVNEGGLPYGRVLEELSESHTDLIPEVNVGEFGGSDHYPFDQSGFRTVYSEEGDFSPNWHRQTDIIDNIDIPYASDIIRSNLGMLLVALETPAPISGLEAVNAGDGHTVYLEWEESPDDEVIGYETYYGTSEDDVVLYDTSYVAADTVYDLDENITYYFAVAGITADGGRSLVEEYVQLTTRSVPVRPDTLVVVPEQGQLRVQWVTIPEMDFDFYQVYRRPGQDGGYEAYTEVHDGEEFVDEGLESNVRYFYYVTQVDTTGLESEPSNSDYAKVISLDSGILFVDETRDFSGGQGNPTDEEQDEFYEFISEGYQVTFHDIISEGHLRINDLGAYSTLVWVDDDPTVQYMADIDRDLAVYLGAGGNIFFAGWRSLASYGIERPLHFEPGSFPYDNLFISSVNSTVSPDFSGAEGLEGWPNLEVLEERVLPQWNGLLIAIDVMELRGGATPIYNYISASQDTLFDGKPAGIVVEGPESNAIFLTFPMYPLGDTAGRELFITAMDLFGEQSTAIGEFGGSDSPTVAFLSQNFPNPFNVETKIRFSLIERVDIQLEIFNILGQKVGGLAEGEFPAGNHFVIWDGDNLPSGVYFYRLTLENGSVSRRMILLR